MIRDCSQFDTWLDEGRDASLAASAHAHAAGCPRCAGALELEALLADPPAVRAGADFTEGVLLRIRTAERARSASPAISAVPELQWWLRAPAEPSVALALVIAALLTWRGDGLWAFAGQLAAGTRTLASTTSRATGVIDAIGHALSGAATGTLASGMLLAVLLPLVGLGSWALYHAIERQVANACSPTHHMRFAAGGAGGR